LVLDLEGHRVWADKIAALALEIRAFERDPGAPSVELQKVFGALPLWRVWMNTHIGSAFTPLCHAANRERPKCLT